MNPIRRRLQSGLLAAYELATRTRIIELPPVQRLYARLYFVYKRRVEARCISAVSAWITSGSVVVDVGAHVGFFTVEFARRVGESGTIESAGPAHMAPPVRNKIVRPSLREVVEPYQKSQEEDPDEEKCRECLRGFQRTIDVQSPRSPLSPGPGVTSSPRSP